MNIPPFLLRPLLGTAPDTSISGGKFAEKLLLCLSILCCFLLLTGSILFYCSHPLYSNPDNSIYLEMADLMLSGKVPYRDFFEWNPPLIMYLNFLPVIISQVLTQPVTLCFNLLTVSFCLVSSIFSLYLIWLYMPLRQQAVFIPAVLAAVIHTNLQTVNMGEREHLFVMCYLPLFILRYMRWQGLPLRLEHCIWAGLIGGLGLAMKPQFYLCAGAAELLMLLNRKPGLPVRFGLFTPESLALLVPGAFHLALLAALPPKAWNIILSQVIPLYSHGFKYSQRALMFMLKGHTAFSNQLQNFLAAGVLVFWLARYQSFLWSCLAFMVVAFINYLMGGQAWSYRMVPMDFAAHLIYGTSLGIVIAGICSLGTIELRRLSALVCTAAVLSLCWFSANSQYQNWRKLQSELDFFDLAKIGYWGRSPERDVDPLFHLIVTLTKPTDKVVFIGNGIEPGYPAILQSGRKCGSRYLFALPVLVQYCIDECEPGQDWPALKQSILRNYEEDIIKNKPRLIIVQKMPMEEILKEGGLYKGCLKNYTQLGELFGNLIMLANDSQAEAQLGRKLIPEKLIKETTEEVEKYSQAKADISSILLGNPTAKETVLEVEIKRLQAELHSAQQENAQLRKELESKQK